MLSRVDDNVLLTNPQGLSIFFYAFMLTLGAISWASGSLYSRTIKSSASIFYLISYQMLAGGVFLLLLGLFSGEMKQLAFEKITLNSSLALTYLIFFGSLITYSAYNWLLRKSTPAKVGTYAFFNPLVAVSLGWLFLNEQVTVRILFGAVGILSAVLLVNQSRFFRRRRNIPRISRNFIEPKEGKNR